MDTSTVKKYIPFIVMPAFLVIVELGSLALSLPVQVAHLAAFQDPQSVANPFIFMAILLGFTAFLLVLIKYGRKSLIAWVIGISIFLTFAYIFWALVDNVFGDDTVAVAVMLILSVLATALLYTYPEWYVIDLLGLLLAAGVASIFGVSLGTVPVILLLVILAIYDAISVYKTKHMITLAEGVIDLKTPILFVIPKKRDYSFIREGIGKLADGGERAAFIIGMGDMIMPSMLVVSANVFCGGTKYFGLFNLPALGAIIGSIAGLAVLLHFVMSGRPQAGLPPLNGGTILGFLVGWALIGFIAARAPVKGAVLERDENLPPFEDLLAEVARARTIMQAHDAKTKGAISLAPRHRDECSPEPEAARKSLGQTQALLGGTLHTGRVSARILRPPGKGGAGFWINRG